MSIVLTSRQYSQFIFRHALASDLKDPELKFWTAPPHAFLVAVDRRDDSVLGTIAFKKIAEDVCEVNRTSVRSGVRKCGIGKKLVAAVKEEAKKLGYSSIYLETTSAQKSAIRLYLRSGFKEIGVDGADAYLPIHVPLCLHSITIHKFLLTLE